MLKYLNTPFFEVSLDPTLEHRLVNFLQLAFMECETSSPEPIQEIFLSEDYSSNGKDFANLVPVHVILPSVQVQHLLPYHIEDKLRNHMPVGRDANTPNRYILRL